MSNSSNDLKTLINLKIEILRPRLLDLSRRNPLIATKLTARSNAHIRVVDELPDVLFYNLGHGQAMRFVPLPPLEDDPRDEQSEAFRNALANARLTDAIYLEASEKIDSGDDEYLDESRKVERALRDRVRVELGLATRPAKHETNLVQHARNNGITPSFDLPAADSVPDSDRYSDRDIQTLQLPKDLERKLSALNSKCTTWIQETGINVLHGAFGFLEWGELNSSDTSLAPLILISVKFEKRKSKEGLEFWVSGIGEEAEVNAVISEKLRLEYGIQLPPFEGGSVEAYLKQVAELAPKTLSWRVRRQVVFGVFPSARIAMYHDLNTQVTDFSNSTILKPLFGGSDTRSTSPFAEEYRVDDPEIERRVPLLVREADSSQFSTLVDIANGKNVAVEGPPGTGKSQTIVNAIAAALAEGKKVLFVAEKMAALDVVRSRLDAVGLGAFLLPLQAEHSTRENVIQSIRDRLEMDEANDARFYDDQVTHFRQSRDELAIYIGILKQLFEDTELTVHDILGRSVATTARLQGLPKELQIADFPIRRGLNAKVMKAIARQADDLHAAWQRTETSQHFWRGIRRASLNRFDVESILNTAESLAGALEVMDQKRCAFDAHGLSGLKAPERLPDLAAVFEKAASNAEMLLGGLLSRLLESSTFKALQNFRADCRNIAERGHYLQKHFVDAVTPALASQVDELIALCGQYKFKGIDGGSLDGSIAAKRQAIAIARKLAEQYRPFAEQVSGSELWRFSDVGKSREIITVAGREALRIRNAAMADPAASPIMKRLNAVGRELLDERAALAVHLSLNDAVSVERLLDCVNTLKSAGFFSILSSEYSRAKKLCGRLTKAKFDRATAIVSLERLAAWKRREEEFLADRQAQYVYGLNFRGLDTEFEVFDRLADFYDRVRETFVRPDQKIIRDFLLSGETELLAQVPKLDGNPDGVTLQFIDDGISRLETEASALENAIGKIQQLSSIFRTEVSVSVDDLPTWKTEVTRYLADRDRLDSHTEMASLLGEDFKGAATDVDRFDHTVLLAIDLQALGNTAQPAASLIAQGKAGDGASLAREFNEAFAEMDKHSAQIDGLTGLGTRSVLKTGSYTDRATALYAAARDEEGLYAHAELASARAEFEPALHGLLDMYLAAKENFAGLGDVLEALAIKSLAKRAYDIHGSVLAKYPGSKLNELRKKLARADKKIIELSREVLKAQVKRNAKPPAGIGIGKKSGWTEMALIENEASKKTKYIPVRDLTRRAGRALLELKPCWMMSPLAVAQYLPKDLVSFDLCIVDEASQMPPEDSVGALVRSRQAMIVGDTNQLPPSSFFRKMIEDEDADEDETVLNESILEMANATFRPARRLRWHYRSRHSGLIKFSNKFVYDDNLVIFPSATESVAGMGVQLQSIDGLYKAGTNPLEAQAMVQAAIRFMKEDPNRSLGIVTLNQKQRDLIFEEMEYALSKDSAAARYVDYWAEHNEGLESFFIKNLENVQGDERDVIFIGTVYGREKAGAPVLNRFGPINGLAGKRRLNVLFSRAKQQIVTFTSMTAADITAEAGGNEGAYMLKRWLEYAATGVLDGGEITHKEPDSDLEIFVMDQIRAMGCTPVPQVGVKGYSIDIGVKHPQWPYGFILGVECDGAAYHSSKSARDRDRLRQDVLEGLGWRFHRIWSTDWFNSPAKQAEILRGVITARMVELKAMETQFSHPVTAKAPEPPVEALEDDHPTIAELIITKPLPLPPAENIRQMGRVAIGDTVRVRYLTDDKRIAQFTISAESSDPSKGIVHCKKPIAEALLGAEEGEEVELLVGSYMRRAVLEKIVPSRVSA